MKKKIITFFLMIIGISSVSADDWVIMINNDIIKCKVVEVAPNYLLILKNESEQQVPLQLVKRIFYENGESMYIGGNQRRNIRPFGLGVNVAGPTIAYGSMYANYYINPKLNFELGTDVMSVYGGFNFFPLIKEKDRMFTPYIGAFISYTYNTRYEIAVADRGIRGYFPMGIQFFLMNGLVSNLEFAFTTSDNYEIGPIYGGIKLSYQFSRN